MNPEYILERHAHGWLIKAVPLRRGVPMTCLQEVLPMMPRDAVIDAGIAGATRSAFAIATPSEAKAWREEIEKSLEGISHPGLRWLRGCDVGMSALTIFLALIHHPAFEAEADQRYIKGQEFKGTTPKDSDDFGRCYRLLQRTPAWESQLAEVAAMCPQTKWSAIVPEWPKLKALFEAGKAKELTEELRRLNQ